VEWSWEHKPWDRAGLDQNGSKKKKEERDCGTDGHLQASAVKVLKSTKGSGPSGQNWAHRRTRSSYGTPDPEATGGDHAKSTAEAQGKNGASEYEYLLVETLGEKEGGRNALKLKTATTFRALNAEAPMRSTT